MPDPISIKEDNFKFLKNGTGSVDIDVQKLPLDQPLDPSSPALLNAKFNAQGATPAFTYGPVSDVSLTISGGVSATLTPFFKPDKVLSDHGLASFFDLNPHKFVLALDIAAQAAAGAAATFKYSALSAQASFNAGANGEFWFSRAYDTNQQLGAVLKDIFSNIRPPSSISGPLAAGEVIYLEYGGSLDFGLSASVGYEMKGSHSVDIANLLLSESYSLSLLGKVGFKAGVAGNFSIQVRASDTDPSWINVSVQKKHSNQFNFAADVTVGLTTESTGLPGSAQDFLGALLGVNAKNWLNSAQLIISSGSIDQLKKNLDTLSQQFVSKWVDKGFNLLSATDFPQILADAHKVVESYQNLDTTAINLFDKYFTLGEPALVQGLTQLRHLTSLDKLAELYTNSNLIKFIEELTGGDPLAFILGKVDLKDPAGKPISKSVLDIFNGRVEDALSLLQDDAHALLKKYITLAKSKFSFDGLVSQLADLTTLDGLKKKADDVLNGFVERIMGTTIDHFDPNKVNKVLVQLQRVSDIEKSLYAKLQDALNQTATLALHAEYTRASESDVLLEIDVNPATTAGSQILHAAAGGDFTGVLSAPITADYRVTGGTLLKQLSQSSKLTFNVAGWHSNFNYSSSASLILNTKQQIVAGSQGMLTVFTTVEATKTEDIEKEIGKRQQELHAAFLLRLVGQSKGKIDAPPSFDKASQNYVVDTVTGMSASYRLLLKDSKASQSRIADFLHFASEFDLQADVNTVLPLLDSETSNGQVDYGAVVADYEVHFLDEAIGALFHPAQPLPADTVRQVMRMVTLGTLLADEDMEDIGWAYSTQGIYDLWKRSGSQFTNTAISLEFPVAPSIFTSVTAPDTVVLKPFQIGILREFFEKEDAIVVAFGDLQKLASGPSLNPNAFASRMKAFSDSFSLIDKGLQTNAMFSVFDKLIAQTQLPASARGSSLKLTSTVQNKPTRTKVFLALPS
ncbi:MAG: hypothetical protein ACXV5J_04040 [Candidatus Angelobacter sp.]